MHTLRMLLNTLIIIGFTIATILIVIFGYADRHELPAMLKKSRTNIMRGIRYHDHCILDTFTDINKKSRRHLNGASDFFLLWIEVF